MLLGLQTAMRPGSQMMQGSGSVSLEWYMLLLVPAAAKSQHGANQGQPKFLSDPKGTFPPRFVAAPQLERAGPKEVRLPSLLFLSPDNSLGKHCPIER